MTRVARCLVQKLMGIFGAFAPTTLARLALEP